MLKRECGGGGLAIERVARWEQAQAVCYVAVALIVHRDRSNSCPVSVSRDILETEISQSV